MASSLYSWLHKGKQSSPLLPSCDDPCTSTSAANRSVERVWARERRKRGKYNHYDAEVRVKIAKHACEYGNKSASVKFTQELGHCVSESHSCQPSRNGRDSPGILGLVPVVSRLSRNLRAPCASAFTRLDGRRSLNRV